MKLLVGLLITLSAVWVSDAMVLEGNAMDDDIPIIQKRGSVDPKRINLWPNAIIPYRISRLFSSNDKEKIRSAVKKIGRAAPCLQFQEYTSNPPEDHIYVFKGDGCKSEVGKQGGGRQKLSLGKSSCLGSLIIHEFLHALGFYHEQNRPDRDQFIRILFQNVIVGKEDNFQVEEEINSQNTPYDRRSIMQYPDTAFSKNGEPTMEWRADSNLRLGGRVLTYYDILQLNNLYCSGLPTPITEVDGCVFPFEYKGVTYSSCTQKNHDELWCSKDAVYKGSWKNCREKDIGGCTFPFKYDDVLYFTCTTKNRSKPWCSKDGVYDGEWQYCE